MASQARASRAMTRYAIYWTPDPAHPLWVAGCAWIGRDAAQPERAFPIRDRTAAPRRYGFHGTLKAPLRLAPGRSEEALLAAVENLAAALPTFAMPALEVRLLQDFVALQPVVPIAMDHPLQVLADRCVVALDVFRDASIADDIARRSVGLDERQAVLFARFGYAFALERWRFHLTLSDSLPDDDAIRATFLREAKDFFGSALAQPLRSTEIAVFIELAPDAPFVLAHRFPLGE